MDNLRPTNSHIRADGFPKMVFEREADAIREAARANAKEGGRYQVEAYECWMRPTHWHLGQVKQRVTR